MKDKLKFTSLRKLDHLRICAEKEVESGDAGFSDIRFVHNALPECDMGSISLATRFLGHTFRSPLFISAMTGGHPGTKDVNARLAGPPHTTGSAWVSVPSGRPSKTLSSRTRSPLSGTRPPVPFSWQTSGQSSSVTMAPDGRNRPSR